MGVFKKKFQGSMPPDPLEYSLARFTQSHLRQNFHTQCEPRPVISLKNIIIIEKLIVLSYTCKKPDSSLFQYIYLIKEFAFILFTHVCADLLLYKIKCVKFFGV